MTFWQTIQSGEYVMFALAVLFIVTVCVWWVRSASLGRESKRYPSLMQRVRDHVMEGDIENSRQICDADNTPGSRMISEGLSRVGQSMCDVESAMAKTAAIEKERMSRGTGWLRCISVISPLLGLGGTLVGVIRSLRDIGESAVPVDTSALCAAIAPCIVTTVAGLGVGVFAVIALTCLEGKVKSGANAIDKLGVKFTDLLNEPS